MVTFFIFTGVSKALINFRETLPALISDFIRNYADHSITRIHAGLNILTHQLPTRSNVIITEELLPLHCMMKTTPEQI